MDTKSDKIVLQSRSFYSGRLVIENIPFIELSSPTFNNETLVKDALTSLTVSVITEYLKEKNDINQTIDYGDYSEREEIKKRLEQYIDMLN